MAAFRKFAPVLRYLIEMDGMYVRRSSPMLGAGVELWADPDFQFLSYGEAKDRLKDSPRNGKILKLRIRAEREPIKGPSAAIDPGNVVPLDGRVAFSQAWTDRANPHPKATPAHLHWHADWWKANAEAFEDHVNGGS